MIDTTHVTKDEQGRWLPAPRKAYAIISIRSPLWGYGEDHDRIVGTEITGPLPVFVNAGKTLLDAVGISATFGDEIYTAIACSRQEFFEFLREELKKNNAAVERCPEF